ncbi:MAG: NADPH-dependent FMN reductase [Phycisphaeraceae bacterium]
MRVLVLSCSLNPESRSAQLAEHAAEVIREMDAAVELLDLRRHDLPLCDGTTACPAAGRLAESIERADAVLLAVPVYNYDANAAVKNLIEFTGRAWTEKLVGFICAAGGQGSYMALMSLANSLMLDFRCLIVPRFVFATGEAFPEQGEIASDVAERIKQLAGELVRLGTALASAEPPVRQSPA